MFPPVVARSRHAQKPCTLAQTGVGDDLLAASSCVAMPAVLRQARASAAQWCKICSPTRWHGSRLRLLRGLRAPCTGARQWAGNLWIEREALLGRPGERPRFHDERGGGSRAGRCGRFAPSALWQV